MVVAIVVDGCCVFLMVVIAGDCYVSVVDCRCLCSVGVCCCLLLVVAIVMSCVVVVW